MPSVCRCCLGNVGAIWVWVPAGGSRCHLGVGAVWMQVLAGCRCCLGVGASWGV